MNLVASSLVGFARLMSPGLVAAFVVLALGCETNSPPAQASSPGWVALQRTPGTDPSAPRYTVTLYENGKVLFEGQSGVKWTGAATKTISATQAARIFRELDAIDFWNRQPRYDVERADRGVESVITKVASPDTSWDIISARHRGRFKRIDGLFFAPFQLLQLKALIENSVGLSDWVDLPTTTGK
jgi:hypothetical protein